MHFLIIDDDTVARTTLKNHLTAMFAGCKISEAANGAQGLFQFFKKKPDLVFLDMLMPIMDGRAVLVSMLDTMQIDQMRPLADSPLVGTTIKKPVTRTSSSRSRNFSPAPRPDLSPAPCLANPAGASVKKSTIASPEKPAEHRG